MIAWPNGVSKTILQDTTGKFRSGTVSDTMRSGKKKSRLISTTSPKPFSVAMILTRAELEIFEAWYETDLRFGTLTFQFPKIAGSGDSEYRILDTNPPSWSQWGSSTVKLTMSWEEQ